MPSSTCTLPSGSPLGLQTAPGPVAASTMQAAEFRQLRHHTKNALQRLMQIVEDAPELGGETGRTLRDSLQHRILVTADLSDALFGLTRDPGDVAGRLRRLSLGLVELLGEDLACIDVAVEVEGRCPADLHDDVARLAHELVGNAVRHGMYRRLLGAVAVTLRSTAGRTTLTVVDDGWGFGQTDPSPGEGLSLVDLLLRPHGGAFRITRRAGRTVAAATIPHAGAGEAGACLADHPPMFGEVGR